MLGCRQSPRDVTTANLLKRKLVKNVVGLQKFDQELRVSYKPTAFRRWVVDDSQVIPEEKTGITGLDIGHNVKILTLSVCAFLDSDDLSESRYERYLLGCWLVCYIEARPILRNP